jgi:hypothetical protein
VNTSLTSCLEESDHRLIELQKDIQDGIKSGKAAPLTMQDVKIKARLNHIKSFLYDTKITQE